MVIETRMDGKIRVYKNFIWRSIIVPAEFISDGISSPPLPLVRLIFPRYDPRILEAAVVHDYLCLRAGKNKAERARADRVFRDMLLERTNKARAYLGYAGVRVGAYLGIGVH